MLFTNNSLKRNQIIQFNDYWFCYLVCLDNKDHQQQQQQHHHHHHWHQLDNHNNNEHDDKDKNINDVELRIVIMMAFELLQTLATSVNISAKKKQTHLNHFLAFARLNHVLQGVRGGSIQGFKADCSIRLSRAKEKKTIPSGFLLNIFLSKSQHMVSITKAPE